ncbi:MAG: thiol:disulfide interchange protein DsbA/DsbL [Thermomonas sp.]
MNARFALLLMVLLPLAACKNETPAPVSDAATADVATSNAADAKPASSEDPEARAIAEANVQAAAEAAAKSPPPVAGVDYVEIPNGQAFDTTDGRIEVAEIFGYVCPACAAVQPTVHAMKAKFPGDVHMVYVPAAFGSMWDTYAKAYYTAEAMGLVEKTHEAMFRAIHIDKTLKGERGIDTPEEIAAFYQSYGADPKQFVSSMASFAIAAKLNRARQWATASFGSAPGGTPTFVVNGKYRVTGKTWDDAFRVINQLVVAERVKAAALAPAAAASAAPPAAEPAAATP